MKQYGQLLGEHAAAVNPQQASPVSLSFSSPSRLSTTTSLLFSSPRTAANRMSSQALLPKADRVVNTVWMFQVEAVIATVFTFLSSHNDK